MTTADLVLQLQREAAGLEPARHSSSETAAGQPAGPMQRLAGYNRSAYAALMRWDPRSGRFPENRIDAGGVEEMRAALLEYLDQYGFKSACYNRYITVLALFLTFVQGQPLHPPGMFDPNGVVHYHGGMVCCPLRRAQLQKGACLCRFCVSACL